MSGNGKVPRDLDEAVQAACEQRRDDMRDPWAMCRGNGEVAALSAEIRGLREDIAAYRGAVATEYAGHLASIKDLFAEHSAAVLTRIERMDRQIRKLFAQRKGAA